MAQPKFKNPDFIENNSAEEIHRRMMDMLPADIDDMPGGFPYDFTMPAALEKAEFINYNLVRTLMIAFPQYAYGEWLDLHGKQVNLTRHRPKKAYGTIKVTGTAGTEIAAGTVFCTPATDTGPSVEFNSLKNAVIGEDGVVIVPVEAAESGTASNVKENTVVIMAKPDRNISGITNPEDIKGGTEEESNDAFYDRIALEYSNSMTYIGNDPDYERWAKQAGAGDCIVIPVAEGPGTVKLFLIDRNGKPANEKLVADVYNYIVSPNNRSRRLLPTACCKLICDPAPTVRIDFTITGLVYDGTTDIRQIKEDFAASIQIVFSKAKQGNLLRYNDVRPVISGIAGVTDFDNFLMDGDTKNIEFGREEYPEVGSLDFAGKEI